MKIQETSLKKFKILFRKEQMKQLEKELYSEEIYPDFGEQPEVLEIQIGYMLIPLVENDKPILRAINYVRNEIDCEFGLPLPQIRIRDNMCLGPTEYAILLNGTKVGGFNGLSIGQILCFDTGEVKEKISDSFSITKEPVFGLEALIIDESRSEEAKSKGYICSNLEKVLRVHLDQIIKSNLTLFLNQCIVNNLINKVRPSNPDVIDSIFFEHDFSISKMKKLLNILLEEKVSIRDMNTILETIADNIENNSDPLFLAERAREKLAYQFFSGYKTEDNIIEAIRIEARITENITESKELCSKISEHLIKIVNEGKPPVFICKSDIRRSLFVTLSQVYPEIIFISDTEMLSCKGMYSLKIIGEIDD